MSTTSQNGARAKILRALAAEGMLTVSEIAETAGLNPDQARDNANHAAKDGLVTKERDDITNSLAYKITPSGREYLAERCRKAGHELSGAGLVSALHLQEAMASSLRSDLAEDSGQSDLAASVDAIDATEPAPPPEQYAICRSGQGHLSAWPLRDMTIEAARQLAIDDAAAIGGEVVLYRCVPIGKAFPRIVFEEA